MPCYVQTVMIGSSKVVIGFEPPTFDPVATAAAVKPYLEADKVYLDLVALKASLATNLTTQQTIWTQWKTCTPGSVEYDQCEKDFRAAQAAYTELCQRIKLQGELVQGKYRVLMEEYGVRFTISGVEVVDQATYDSLCTKKRACATDKKLLFDGTYVVDFIGLKYWTKPVDTWIETEITELGVEKPAVDAWEWDELSKTQIAEIEDQIDIARIATLTTEEKTEEKQEMLAQALVDAGQKRSEFEIKNTLDPLAEAQAWYAAKVTWLDARYA